MTRVLLVGQAPNHDHDGCLLSPGMALTGATGRRLAEAAGVSWLRYLRATERVNLLESWPGPAAGGKGDAFPSGPARLGALNLMPRLDGRRVIFLGRGVAGAFGLVPPLEPLTWCLVRVGLIGDRVRGVQVESDVDLAGVPQVPVATFRAALVPHPSRVNLWWNLPANAAAAGRFLSEAFAAKED